MPGVYIVHAAPLFSEARDVVGKGGTKQQLQQAALESLARSRINSLDVDGSRTHPSLSTLRLEAVASFGPQVEHSGAAFGEDLSKSRAASASASASARTSADACCDRPQNSSCLMAIDPDSNHDRVFLAIRRVLRPIFFIFVVYGAVPVRLDRTLRISVHPWRSTLLYVVAVQLVVGWSVHRVVRTYGSLLRSEATSAAGVDQRLLAAQSVVHVASHFILFVAWAELHLLKHCGPHVALFMERHVHMVADVRLCFVTRAMPWLAAIFAFVIGPCMVLVWCNFILVDESRMSHAVSHAFQVAFAATSVSLSTASGLVLRDLADNLATKLHQELSTGRATASRLEDFRQAWICLRSLTGDLGCMPVTGLSMLVYLLVMITLSGYQTVVSYANHYPILFASSLGLLVLCQSGILVLCDAPHRLTEQMNAHFYESLEARSWRCLSQDLLIEHQQFLHTISSTPAEVSYAGMVTLKRSTYLSMMAAISTYLIVLFQLRLSDEDRPTFNATETSLLPLQ